MPNDQKSTTAPLEEKIELERNPLKRLFLVLGPGLITGASDDDPSGIGTYTTAGASLGFATLWTAILTLPMMAAVQFICAKIGMVSGRGLSGVLRKYYPGWLVYSAISLLLIAYTINAGTDIGAIAAAINLLVPIPAVVLVLPIAVAIMVLQIWGTYNLILKIFKWLTLTLFAYVIAAFLARPHWSEVLKATFIPTLRFDNQYLTRLVFYFVILASAATLHATGNTKIETAVQAAQALRPLSSGVATVLFALGLIGCGFLAVPVLTTSSAYAVCEAFGWKYGLDEKLRSARRF